MKITCPSCAAEYNVPGTVAEGRVVRCAKCATEWAPMPALPVEDPAHPPPIPAPEPEPPVEPAPPARLVPAVPPSPPTRRWPLVAAWLGSGVVIVAALAAVFVFRAPIMQRWPPSQRVYGVLGLAAAASPHVQGDVVK